VPFQVVAETARVAEDHDDDEGALVTRHLCETLLASARIIGARSNGEPRAPGAYGASRSEGTRKGPSRKHRRTPARGGSIDKESQPALGLLLRGARVAAVGGAHARRTRMFFSVALLGRAAKRLGYLRLTTKRAKKGYYKGKGAISTGRFTKAGASRGPRPRSPDPRVTLTDRTFPRPRSRPPRPITRVRVRV
jgi:hypothetical protein